MRFSRLLVSFLIVFAILNTGSQAEDVEPQMTVTFLGTNGPMPEFGRVGTSTLIEAGGELLLFDAGLNVTQQLVNANKNLAQVTHLFITHLHSDHIAGLPGLWSSTWLRRRSVPLNIYGPTGVETLATGIHAFFARDIPTRIHGPEALPEGGVEIQSYPFAQETIVFEQNGVKVTAIEVDHGVDVGLAFGYRLDFKGMSVVLSGDTTFNQNLIQQSQGVDLLIHEVMGVSQELLDAGRYKSGVLEVHTTPEQAGEVFRLTQPKLAAFTHVIYGRQPGFAVMSPEELLQRTASRYSGEVILPQELDSIVITPDGVHYKPR